MIKLHGVWGMSLAQQSGVNSVALRTAVCQAGPNLTQKKQCTNTRQLGERTMSTCAELPCSVAGSSPGPHVDMVRSSPGPSLEARRTRWRRGGGRSEGGEGCGATRLCARILESDVVRCRLTCPCPLGFGLPCPGDLSMLLGECRGCGCVWWCRWV